MDIQHLETHEYLPSGLWEGFYCYDSWPTQHKMQTELTFENNCVKGSGLDDINTFKWNGNYDLNTFKLRMTKTYPTHKIFYKGDIDENGIWGVWDSLTDVSNISPKILKIIKERFKHKIQGGFHLWPIKNDAFALERSIAETKEESEILKEVYIEHFS